MAQNSSSDILNFDAIGSPSQVTVSPSSAYTVASNVNRVKAGGAITITLDANSNSPVYIDSNAHACVVTDGTRNYDIGDTSQTVSCLCVKVGGAGNDWIVIGAVLS